MTDERRTVVVATAQTEMEAEVIASRLESEGINAKVMGGLTSGFRAEGVGLAQIVVFEEDAERAVEIIRADEATAEGD